jgi:hypothetical protein
MVQDEIAFGSEGEKIGTLTQIPRISHAMKEILSKHHGSVFIQVGCMG